MRIKLESGRTISIKGGRYAGTISFTIEEQGYEDRELLMDSAEAGALSGVLVEAAKEADHRLNTARLLSRDWEFWGDDHAI